MLKALWNFLTFWSRLSTSYTLIANDPEKREKSVRFGVQSIICSILGAALITLCMFGVATTTRGSSSLEGLVGIVVAAFLVLIAVVSLVQLIVRGLIVTVYQLKLNKHPVGKAALAIWIIAVIAAIALSVVMFAVIVK